MVVNAILPALSTGSTSVVSSSRTAAERIKTAIKIIHVAPPSGREIQFWVKNVGSTDIPVNKNVDVFLDDELMEFKENPLTCPGDDNMWSYDGDAWTPSTTIEIIICSSSSVSSSVSHTVQFTTGNAVTAEKSF